ncbi:hypothetical protein Q7C36_016360 [Tachysurus vachellii]|uniref:Uncharacterized protein n=1 Tax=Tachysurus vachellii TaxID=175792 RepID=A0AA88M5Y5_TACVA|nr:hypothetical protein Q7C36_016360 [Tachysurus vachellii]
MLFPLAKFQLAHVRETYTDEMTASTPLLSLPVKLRAQEHLEDRSFRRIGVSDPAILVPVIGTELSELDERQQMRCRMKGQRMLHSRQRSDNERRI